MKAVLVAVAVGAIAVSAAACSGGGGGGGSGSISAGSYTTSNSRYSPDGCNVAAQQPASSYDGQTLVVTTSATSITINGQSFSGSGTSFATAVLATNLDLSGFGIDCIIHTENSSSVTAHGVDMFTVKGDAKASKVSGTQCDSGSLGGISLPCETAILSDAAK